ncbi:phosphatidylinositol phosphatase PTPRQ-like [Homarus americanus]|uniref:phosphatidylinositol phosphatase PTPRQ-like n=1 Tax=Homarus americanus TaxID=6706 RepID=UPI001C4818DA|nr:phosphatidylinositol phosphatase PTPRQ-like [Homarus americanus]
MAAKVMDNSSQLFVNWTAAQGVGNCVVTYRITWRPVSESNGSGTSYTTSLSHTITQLEAWTTYQVCVAATTKTKYNNDKCTNTTTDEDTPGPPAITRIHSTTSDSLLVVWEPPEKPRGIITNYSVTWNTSVVPGVTGNITQYTITSLEACTLYNITVKAATIKGYGDCVDANGTTGSKPPEATQKVSCDLPTSPHDLTVSWSSITSSCPVLRYTVNYTGHVLWSHDNTHGSRDTDTIYVDLRNLTPWTAYNVCVAGVIVNNIVGAWNCCQATTPESAPGPPASLNLTDKSSSSVKVCWDEPVQLNGELTLYQLIWGANNKSLSHNLTSYTISGLQSNSLYNVTLQAGTAAGVGPPVWDAVTTDKGVNVGGIVAGVVVGVLLLALIVAAVVFRDKLKDKMKKRTPPTSPPPELPMTSRPPSVVVSTEVKKNELHEYIEYLEGDTHRALDAELAQIDEQSPSFPHFHARKDFNKPKNRFQNIYPFDHARVKLSPIPGVEGSEYINASYVLDIHERPYFIATQGPKLNTVKDFWRMVMERSVHHHHALQRQGEGQVVYRMYPNETCINIGSYIIRNHREERQELYSIRYLEVAAGEQKRMVKQYHFTAWPDFGAPKHVTDLLDFMADIRSTMPTNGDHLLVHCSAGVGRTGTFIGLWNLIDEADADTTTEYVNIKQTVMKMRKRRPIMVQSTEQFLYLTKCISAYLEAPHLWAKQQEDDNHIYDNGAFEDNDDPIYVNT